jgi:hypothetical protein
LAKAESPEDLLRNLREKLLALDKAKLVAQRKTTDSQGRVGYLCQWEEKSRGKIKRRLVTFQYNGKHELVSLEQE